MKKAWATLICWELWAAILSIVHDLSTPKILGHIKILRPTLTCFYSIMTYFYANAYYTLSTHLVVFFFNQPICLMVRQIWIYSIDLLHDCPSHEMRLFFQPLIHRFFHLPLFLLSIIALSHPPPPPPLSPFMIIIPRRFNFSVSPAPCRFSPDLLY